MLKIHNHEFLISYVNYLFNQSPREFLTQDILYHHHLNQESNLHQLRNYQLIKVLEYLNQIIKVLECLNQIIIKCNFLLIVFVFY